jgi:PTH1 family peptidyl-tRNA hydrolase
MKYLIVGLGNVGPEYAFTRHNVGFMVLDRLAAQHNLKFSLERHAFFTEWKYKGKQLVLIKPTTYMNLSGKAVLHYMRMHKIPIENVLILVDEIQLDFGILRLKSKGSHGGHNGLKNIQELLSTTEYPRLRCGIGGNFSKGRQVDYVLGDFTEDEMAGLPLILDKAGEMILSFCTAGINNTMNLYNQ